MSAAPVLFLSPDAPFRDLTDWEDEDGAQIIEASASASDAPASTEPMATDLADSTGEGA